MDMKDLIGKRCRMSISLNNHTFYYTVKQVMDFDDPYITILDKFDKTLVFHKDTVLSITDIS